MFNLMRSELIKLSRSALPWVVGGLCVLLDVGLFANYTEEGSSVFEPTLLPLGQVASLLLTLFLAVLGVIPAVLIGCYVGARDYGIRTVGSTVHWGGRYRPLVGKVGATTLVLCVFVVVTGLLGFLLGLFHDSTVTHVNLPRLLGQTGLVIVATAMLGLLALTVATIVRSVAVANLICLVVLLGQMSLPPAVGRIIRFANPVTFLGEFADPVFSNLDGLTNVALSFDSDLSISQSISGLIIYVLCCVGALTVVARLREYR